jgi:AcrR family transcriptional regulator
MGAKRDKVTEGRPTPLNARDAPPAPSPESEMRAALIVAHPGHELRVHHWVELARPLALVLTDGSGRTANSRLGSTTRVLGRAGARIGPVYGRFTDAAIYEAMLERRHDVFLALLEEITGCLIAERIDYVASDALEGYNSSHELCGVVVGAACALVERRAGRFVRHFEFPLTGPCDACPADLRPLAIHVRLDEAAVARKRAAAVGYPELQREVEDALERDGSAALDAEWLRPASVRAASTIAAMTTPYYETYGEAQVAAGHYRKVIRRREHLLPVAEALWTRVTESDP